MITCNMQPILDTLVPFRDNNFFLRICERTISITTYGSGGGSVNDRWPLALRIIRYCLIWHCVKCIIFYNFNINHRWRVLIFDQAYILNFYSELNIIVLLCCIYCLYIQHQLYTNWAKTDLIRLPYNVMYKPQQGGGGGGSGERCFITSYLDSGHYAGKPITLILHKLGICMAYSLAPYTFITYLMSVWIHLYRLLPSKLNDLFPDESQNTTISDRLVRFLMIFGAFIVTQVQAFQLDITSFGYTELFAISIGLPMYGIVINLIRLNQTENILHRCLDRLGKMYPKHKYQSVYSRTFRHLSRFHRYHIQCFRSICSYNQAFRGIMFWFLMTVTPMNTYTFMSLLLGRVATEHITQIALYCFAQFFCLFGFHLVLIQFPFRIHRPVKLLLRINAFVTYGKFACNNKCPNFNHRISNHLRLANRIFALHTTNQYGLTYGKITLINMATFARFAMFYYKFMTFSYKINKFHSNDIYGV